MSKVCNVGIQQYRYHKIRVCVKDSILLSENAIANKLGLHISNCLENGAKTMTSLYFFKNSTKTGQAKRSKTKCEPGDVQLEEGGTNKYILTINFIKDLKNKLVKT